MIIGSFLGKFLDFARYGDASARIVRSVAIPLFIGGGAALQAYAGAFLVRWFVGMPTALATEKEVVRFSAVSTATCVIASTIGVTRFGSPRCSFGGLFNQLGHLVCRERDRDLIFAPWF
jgi:hypothetical protein